MHVVAITSKDAPDPYPYIVGPFPSLDEAEAWISRIGPKTGRHVEIHVRPVWSPDNVDRT